ncbi:solute carrier family 22 member 20-like [Dromiciops gliroides]|uniref:solute carrier family 22 member 20-like n=1 Tax=Dromiciops gliroides TaxID=33562 RepID=UPI001CC7B557|nr:solute carrier family 22 member 20-like [Dromiciops gliroides]
MGYYQVMQIILTFLCGVLLACHNFQQNFAAGVPEHHCWFQNQTGAESLSLGDDRNGDLLKVSIPMDKEGKPERCLRFTEPQWHLLNHNATEELKLETEGCLDGWVYDQNVFLSSIVIEWNLVCERKSLKSLIQTIFMGGQQAGSIVFGMLSDRFGRRTMLLWSSLMATTVGIFAAFAPTFAAYATLIFLNGASLAGITLTCLCLTLEWTPLKTRMMVHTCNSYAFSVGQMVLSGWAYLVREWNWLQFSTSVPFGIILLYSLYVSRTERQLVNRVLQESACWLIIHNKLHVAVKTLQRVARINGKKEQGRTLNPEVVMSYIQEDLAVVKTSPFLTDLVRTPGIRMTTFCIMLEWFACGFSFYGLGLDLQKFGFSIYWIQTIFALVDFPGKLLASISMSYLGRRITLIFLTLLPGTMIIISIFVPQDMSFFWMILSIIGKGGLGGAISCLYLYTQELYPTEIRQMGMSAGLFSIRFGSLLAPIVYIIGNYIPILKPLSFGIVPILSATSAYFLTETRDLSLPETIQEAENRVKKSCFLKRNTSKYGRDRPDLILPDMTQIESTV